MKQRNPIAVFLLPFVTFGIYGIVWQVKTKNEMNQLGANIPTAWLIIVPFVNFYWLWKYSEGVEKVTNGSISAVLAFVLQALLGSIGGAILQNEFNKPAAAVAGATPAPLLTPQPDASFGGPVSPAELSPNIAQPTTIQPATTQTFSPLAPTSPEVIAPIENNNAQPTQQS